MNICKTVAGIATVFALGIIASGSVMAQSKIADTGPGSVTFTQGSGPFSISGSTLFNSNIGMGTNIPATITFSAAIGTFTSSGNSFTQNFTGGTFTVNPSGGGSPLLAGTFGPAVIQGFSGASSGTFQLTSNSLNYNPASTMLGGFSPLNGSLGVTFTGISSNGGNGFSFTPGVGLNSFTATDQVVYAAVRGTTVPEPGTYAAFAFTGIGAMGLMLRARKSRGSMSA